jgi:hypothetical protein
LISTITFCPLVSWLNQYGGARRRFRLADPAGATRWTPETSLAFINGLGIQLAVLSLPNDVESALTAAGADPAATKDVSCRSSLSKNT